MAQVFIERQVDHVSIKNQAGTVIATVWDGSNEVIVDNLADSATMFGDENDVKDWNVELKRLGLGASEIRMIAAMPSPDKTIDCI